MPTLVVKHEGGMASSLSTRGHRVIVDVPQQKGGEDRGPTPVELLAGSLGTCIVFYVARWCKEAKLDCEGFSMEVEFVHDMEAHCVPVLNVKLIMPAGFPEARKAALLKVANSCTVHNTLCSIPKIQVTVGESVAA